MKRLLIIGAGGHGRSVAEAVSASGAFIVAEFLDDAFPELERVWDVPVLGKVAADGSGGPMTRPASFRLVVAVGTQFTDKLAGRPKEVGGRRELDPAFGCTTACQMVLSIS